MQLITAIDLGTASKLYDLPILTKTEILYAHTAQKKLTNTERWWESRRHLCAELYRNLTVAAQRDRKKQAYRNILLLYGVEKVSMATLCSVNRLFKKFVLARLIAAFRWAKQHQRES